MTSNADNTIITIPVMSSPFLFINKKQHLKYLNAKDVF